MPVPFADLQLQYRTIKSEIDDAIAAVIGDNAFIRGSPRRRVSETRSSPTRSTSGVACPAPTALRARSTLRYGRIERSTGDEVIATAHSWIWHVGDGRGHAGATDSSSRTPTTARSPSIRRRSKAPSRRGRWASYRFISTGSRRTWTRSWRSRARMGCWVIEDCAQAHLARCKGRQVGTLRRRRDLFVLSGQEPRRDGRRRAPWSPMTARWPSTSG